MEKFMQKPIMCILVFFLPVTAMTGKSLHLVNQQENLLCLVPQNVLWTVCKHLGSWKDIHLLGSTCKDLDRRATVCGKKIYINLGRKRVKLNEPVSKFLDGALDLIRRIASKQGNNPIELELSSNDLADNLGALNSFVQSCTAQDIVKNIKKLYLANNGIVQLPATISGLVHLENLDLGCNTLNQESLRLVSQLIVLKNLNLSSNRLTLLSPELSGLQYLDTIDVGDNKLSLKEIFILCSLKNLTYLRVSHNCLTFKELLGILHLWPLLKTVYASALECAETDFATPLSREITIYC